MLDAKPYSLNGQPENKASYNQNRFGVTIGGPLNIPAYLQRREQRPFFSAAIRGSRSTNPYDVFSTVPTAAERAGDFSAQPVQLFDPLTHNPLANNQITNINPAAAQLLSFIPAAEPAWRQQEFPFCFRQLQATAIQGSSASTTTLVRSSPECLALGGRGVAARQRRQQQQNQKKEKEHWSQSINGMFSYNNIRNTVLNPFPGLGGKQSVNNTT